MSTISIPLPRSPLQWVLGLPELAERVTCHQPLGKRLALRRQTSLKDPRHLWEGGMGRRGERTLISNASLESKMGRPSSKD